MARLRPHEITQGDRIGPYIVERRLGEGGMAEVFAALEERTGASVALKRSLVAGNAGGPRMEMFEREARIACALVHPNIVRTFGTLEDATGTPVLVMELLDGITAKAIARELRPTKDALRLLTGMVVQAAAALDHLHAQQDPTLGVLIHRDVSPDNLFVGMDGTLKLLDFGLAKHVDDGRLTQAGMLKGKAAYMAPEQINGSTLDRRTDEYALAVTWYNLITGRSPFERDNVPNTLDAVLTDDYLPVSALEPRVPARADVVIGRALSRDLSERYPSCGEFARALAEALGVSHEPLDSRRELATRVRAAVDAAEQRLPTIIEARKLAIGNVSDDMDVSIETRASGERADDSIEDDEIDASEEASREAAAVREREAREASRRDLKAKSTREPSASRRAVKIPKAIDKSLSGELFPSPIDTITSTPPMPPVKSQREKSSKSKAHKPNKQSAPRPRPISVDEQTIIEPFQVAATHPDSSPPAHTPPRELRAPRVPPPAPRTSEAELAKIGDGIDFEGSLDGSLPPLAKRAARDTDSDEPRHAIESSDDMLVDEKTLASNSGPVERERARAREANATVPQESTLVAENLGDGPSRTSIVRRETGTREQSDSETSRSRSAVRPAPHVTAPLFHIPSTAPKIGTRRQTVPWIPIAAGIAVVVGIVAIGLLAAEPSSSVDAGPARTSDAGAARAVTEVDAGARDDELPPSAPEPKRHVLLKAPAHIEWRAGVTELGSGTLEADLPDDAKTVVMRDLKYGVSHEVPAPRDGGVVDYNKLPRTEVRILVRPWAEVSLGSEALGTTPIKPLMLVPGKYTLKLRHEDALQEQEIDVVEGPTMDFRYRF